MAAYDPRQDRWTRLPDLPETLGTQPRVTTLGDKLIATGGDHFQVFDLSTSDWRSYPPPPVDAEGVDRLLGHGRAVYALTDPSNPQSPVQRLDLRTGDWAVLTRRGMGAATTRAIFWTQVGLVSAGYDNTSGSPVPAVAKYAHGAWHRYDAPPLPVSPAPFVQWGATIVIAAPPGAGAQGLDPGAGTWLRVPGSLAKSVFLPDGRPAIPPRGPQQVLFHEQRLYKVNGHSHLWEQPFNIA